MSYNNYYNNIANIYDEIRLKTIDSFFEKIKYLKSTELFKRNMKVLEIGTGTGEYINKLSIETEIDGIGIDKNAKMIEIAKHKNNKMYSRADARKLPFTKNYFNIVLAVNSIHQMGSTRVIFQEVFRVLRKNGYFVIITPNVGELHEFLLYKVSEKLYHYEKNRLPELKTLFNIGAFTGFYVYDLISSKNNMESVKIEDYLISIENRFLSCLMNVEDKELRSITQKIKKYCRYNKINKAYPYAYYILILKKYK